MSTMTPLHPSQEFFNFLVIFLSLNIIFVVEIGDILAPDAELEEDNQPAAYSVPEVEESHEESVEESNVYGNSFESEVDPYTPKKDVKTAAVKTYSQPPKKEEEERPPPVKFEPVVVPATSLKKASEIVQPTQHSNPQPADPKVVENQKSRPKNSDSEASTVRSVIPPQEFPKPQANSGKDFATSAMPNPPPVQPLHHQEKLTVDPTLNSQPSFPLQPPPHQSPYPQSAGNPSNPFTYPQQSFPPYPPHPQYPQPQSSQHYQQQMPPVSPQIPTPGYPFHPQYPSYPQFPQSPHIPPPVPSQWPSQAMYPPYSFPPPPYQYYPPQPPLSYPANPFLPNPYQALMSNPLQASQFSAQQSLAQLLQRSGLVPPAPPETSEPTMAEILRELQAAKVSSPEFPLILS